MAESESDAIDLLARAFAQQDARIAALKEDVSRLTEGLEEKALQLQAASEREEVLCTAVERCNGSLSLQVDFQVLFESKLRDEHLLKTSLKEETQRAAALQKQVHALTFESELVSTYKEELGKLSSAMQQEREAMEAAALEAKDAAERRAGHLQRSLAAALEAKEDAERRAAEAARAGDEAADRSRRAELDMKNRLMKAQVEIDRLRAQARALQAEESDGPARGRAPPPVLYPNVTVRPVGPRLGGSAGTAQRKRAAGKLALAGAGPHDKRAKTSAAPNPASRGRLPGLEERDECWEIPKGGGAV